MLYGPYEFIVKVWNDITNNEDTYRGVCFSRTYTGAMEKIVKEYGEEEITEVKIAANMNSPVYEFSTESGVLFNPENVKLR